MLMPLKKIASSTTCDILNFASTDEQTCNFVIEGKQCRYIIIDRSEPMTMLIIYSKISQSSVDYIKIIMQMPFSKHKN